MGFKAKKFGKSAAKFGKSAAEFGKSVVNTVTGITVGIVTGKFILKATGKAVEFVGYDILDDVLGLDKIGNEVGQTGSDVTQIGKVLEGDYHDAIKKIEEEQQRVKAYGDSLQYKIDTYNLTLQHLQDRIDSLIAFDEIYKMAISNRTEDFVALGSSEINTMTDQYNLMVRNLQRLITELKNEYDLVIGLTQGSFTERLLGSVIMIVGGLASDFKEIGSGRANSETWKRIGTTMVSIIAIVALFFVPGLQGVSLALAVTLASISLFLSLDGMYSNGAATGAIMGMLDFLFNDVLNLDDAIGSDFNKFDKDHEDYQQMVGYVKLSIMLASIATAWISAPPPPSGLAKAGMMSKGSTAGAGSNALNQASASMTMQSTGTASVGSNPTAYLDGTIQVGKTLSDTSVFGLKFSTYSDIYKAYTTALDVNDVIAMYDQYKQLKDKLEADMTKVNEALASKADKSMVKHFKDSAYFLQDQQESIDRYIWSMTSQNMYVDPYGTTPVANIRFEPDKDTRGMSFGFEDVFNESTQAGSRAYFNNIIYGG